ncbi:hypothetical protein, partial [Rubrivirga sp.]|uniref:hypothetical protein n=1 Tax=Rubrivirga sp. TaxID=1885344 RepID=UPI003C73D2BB
QRRMATLEDPSPSRTPTAAGGSIEDLLDRVDADPRAVDAWVEVLRAMAQAGDARAGETADDALLLFGSVPSVLVGAAEAYVAADRGADALDASARALEAITLLGDALQDADALRARLDALPL